MTPDLFQAWTRTGEGIYQIEGGGTDADQLETNDAFSEKWTVFSEEDAAEQEGLFEFQKAWFLKLYGFETEDALKDHLSTCATILDAGCGLGYKAAWFAALAPHATVIAIDYSDAVSVAHQRYHDVFPNIVFARGDIADTKLANGMVDFTVCDQVIMHTQDPTATLCELQRITSPDGRVLCYWYRKKALPRELLDDYFRANTASLSSEELWQLSKEVLELGKMLSELEVEADFPDVPSLGIQGGRMDLQRFIYWNFIKCFWNPELGYATSLSANFDWYSPVNAMRFSMNDIMDELKAAGLTIEFFHEEEACYAGRFRKA